MKKKVFLGVKLFRHDETLQQTLILMLRYVTFPSRNSHRAVKFEK